MPLLELAQVGPGTPYGEWRIAERQILRYYTHIKTRPGEFPDVINGWPKSARDRTDPAYPTVRDYVKSESEQV